MDIRRKNVPNRGYSPCAKALRRDCVYGEEGKMKTGRKGGGGGGNGPRKSLGNEFLCLVGIVRILTFSLRE